MDAAWDELPQTSARAVCIKADYGEHLPQLGGGDWLRQLKPRTEHEIMKP
jgi:hypothetical protein